MGWLSLVVFLFIFIALAMDSWILAGLSLIGFIGLSLYLVSTKNNESNDLAPPLEAMKSKLKDFKVTHQHFSRNGDSGILIDEYRLKLCLNNLKKYKVYNYTDILGSDILQNGKSLMKVRRETQLGSAVVRNALAESVESIIRATNGKSEAENEVTSLDLKLIVNDSENPIYIINFLKSNTTDLKGKVIPIKTDSEEYIHAFRKINQWHHLFEEWISKADGEEDKKNTISNLNIN